MAAIAAIFLSFCFVLLHSSKLDAHQKLSGSALTSPSTFSDVVCGVGTGYLTKKKNDQKPTALDGADSCQILYASADQYRRDHVWLPAYDTARHYIETCAYYFQSWWAFQITSEGVQGLFVHDTSIIRRYRDWLESVLYLNTTDPEYFCQCVYAIAGTLNYPSDTTAVLLNQRTNRGLSVFQWLLLHTDCDTEILRREYQRGRDAQYVHWLETDTTIALDTTLPSMSDLGLDSLLNLHFSGVAHPAIYSGILNSLTISKNPFTSTTTLHFALDKMAYLKAEVYDELGRMIVGDGSGHSFDPGKHQISFDLTGFASGADYLRVSMGDGEVRTIKLVKKE